MVSDIPRTESEAILKASLRVAEPWIETRDEKATSPLTERMLFKANIPSMEVYPRTTQSFVTLIEPLTICEDPKLTIPLP